MSNVPTASLLHVAHRAPRLGAVGISVTAPDLEEGVSDAVAAVHEESPGVPVLVGGHAVPDEAGARRLGADHWAADGRGAVEVLAGLHG